jgi:ribosome-binding factor A
MNQRKSEKRESLLRELAAKFLEKEASRASLITVTGTHSYDKGRNIKILFTVLPRDKEAAALSFAKRHINDFRQYVEKNARIGRLPMIEFAIDEGEKHRQKIDELINENIKSQEK